MEEVAIIQLWRKFMHEKKSWEQSYVNPYGFVSLAKEEPKRKEIAEWQSGTEERYTGKIIYQLQTLSPLFIPDTTNQNTRDKEEHNEYEFFSYGDKIPVIPGSEVRGMVRSLYETLTNSCISFMNEKEVLSKRTPEYFKAGILKREVRGTKVEYKLLQVHETKDYLYRENGNKDFSIHSFQSENLSLDGSKVYFEQDKDSAPNRPPFAHPFAKNISLKEAKCKKVGYLLKGEAGPKLAKSKGSKCKQCPSLTKKKCQEQQQTRCYLMEKHCAHIFTEEPVWNNKQKKNELPTIISLSKEAFEDICKRMEMILKLYQMQAEESTTVYQEYRQSWEAFLAGKQDGIALYFSKIQNHMIYVSPAKMTREVYVNTLKDILEKQAKHTCCDNELVCPTCALFGTVRNELKIASKIRFSDMQVVKQENYYEPALTLPELSSPKLATTEFYLEKPENPGGTILNWTYDYYVLLPNKNNIPIEKPYIPKLAGRKFYWHSPNTVKLLRSKIIEKNKRNKTVYPLKPNVSFLGEVYFETITKKQLDELIAILNVSQQKKNEKPCYAVKLGMGKPAGLGSAYITVENVLIRTVGINKETGVFSYQEKTYNEMFANEENGCPYQNILLQNQFLYHEEVLKFLDVNALNGKVVWYPYGESSKDEGEGFQWFAENRKAVKINNKTQELDLTQTDAGPKSRKQTIYHRYMGNAEPELLLNNNERSSII